MDRPASQYHCYSRQLSSSGLSYPQEVITVRVQDPRVQNEGSWNSYVDYKIFLHVSASSFCVGLQSAGLRVCAEVEPGEMETEDLEEERREERELALCLGAAWGLSARDLGLMP